MTAVHKEHELPVKMRCGGSWIKSLLGREWYIFEQADREIVRFNKRGNPVTTIECVGRTYTVNWEDADTGVACQMEHGHIFLSQRAGVGQRIGTIRAATAEWVMPLLCAFVFETGWRSKTS